MKKGLPITLIFLLLTLSMTQLATAQKQNIITNATTETLYVISSTKFGAEDDIPAGYRTSGWKTIAAGQQRVFWAYDPHKIYFQIWKGSKPIKPQPATETFTFWINRNANFDIVTQQEISTAITRDQLVHSSHDTSVLTHWDGFMRYDNGSQITVTNAWVDVNTPRPGEGPGVPDDVVDPPSLAQEVFDTYTETFQREDIQEILPQVLEDLKAPRVQARLTPQHIMRFVETPVFLTQFVPGIDPTFVELLGTDGELQALFRDPKMQELLQDLTAIDALTELLTGGVSADDAVNIPDPNLRHAIADALNIPENTPITRAQMESLSVLDDGQLLDLMEWDPTLAPIQNLTGLEFAVNLEELDLPGHNISDISPLENLIKLEELNLSENDISDISPLENLGIFDLRLSDNNISDISPLENLANLSVLDLSGNAILDVSPIANWNLASWRNLGSLYLSDNNISDISPLENLANLDSRLYLLDLSDNNISDISVLANLANLEKLFLYENNISDISPLSGLSNLTELDLSYNRISNFSRIDGLLPNLVNYFNGNQTQQQTGIEPIMTGPSVVSDPQLNIYWAQSRKPNTGLLLTPIWRANLETNTIQAIVPNTNASNLTIDTAGGKIYWINTWTDNEVTESKIQCANLDGSNLQDFFTAGGTGWSVITNLTLDGAGGLYWINKDWNAGVYKIQRANLDGSNLQDILTNIHPWEFTIDPIGKKIYWVDWEGVNASGDSIDRIRRANMDGTNIEDIYITTANPRSITVDTAQRKIYWINGEQILYANLDGSDFGVKRWIRSSGRFLTADAARNTLYWLDGRKRGAPLTLFTLNAADGTIYWTEYDPAQENFAIWQQPFGGEPQSIVTDVAYEIGTLAVASFPSQADDVPPTELPLLEGIEQDYILHGFIGQENQIEGVEFSPDGRVLASIDFDGALLHSDPHTLQTTQLAETLVKRLWIGNLQETHRLRRIRTSRSVAYSPDRQWIAAGTSDMTILLWKAQYFDMNQPPKFTLPAPGQVWAVAFSPDGQTLATGGGYEGIHLWDMRLDPPQLKATLTAKTAQVEGIAFHPDGQTLAVATGQVDEVVHLWDLQTETLKDTLITQQVSVRNIAFSPDGRMLAAGAYSTGGSYGVGEGVLLWKQAPLPPEILANLTPHSVELSGPTIVGPGRPYTFTVHVKNGRGVGIKNALVSAKRTNLQTHTINSVTDAQGNAEVNLQFPDVGKHDINVTVLERVTQQELKQTFSDRVEVPRPHAIAPAVPQPKPRTIGASYADAFTVTSADGRLLEGFRVQIRIGKFSNFPITDNPITDNKGIARITTRLSTLGTYDVNVAVLAGGTNPQEVLKKTFPRRVTIIPKPSCTTTTPSNIEPLERVRVYQKYERTKISEGIFDNQGLSGTVKAAVAGDPDRHNRTWTIYNTVVEGSGTLVLTVKFLSATEAAKLLDTYKNFLIENYTNGREVYEESGKEKYKGTFVDPPDEMIDNIKAATKEWSVGNIDWVYILPGESGDSDIRVAFLDPEKLPDTWNSAIGSPSYDERPVYKRSITMNLSTDASYGTLLHEFGHALGLIHEHQSPQFTDIFEWDDTEPDGWADTYPHIKWDSIAPADRIYKKIAFYFSKHYTPETITKGDAQAKDIDNSFLKVPEAGIDEVYSAFDNTSVMTYALDPALLKTKPGASLDARQLVDEEWAKENGFRPPLGIGRSQIPGNDERLSKRDKKFITDLYGTAIEKVKIEGSVHIKGEEHDCGGFACLGETKVSRINKTVTVPSAVLGDAKEYVRAYEPFTFKWGGEQRVEVYLHNRQVRHRESEIAVTGLLFHGGSENSKDLDDVACGTFQLRVGYTQKVKFTLNVDWDWSGDDTDWCDALNLDPHTSGLKGGDVAPGVNGYNKATVTVELRAYHVPIGTPIDAPAAPSIAAIVNTAGPKHDVNGDGEINAADLLLVSQYFGRIPPETPAVDVNNDNTVTIADLVQIAQHLQLSRVPAAPTGGMPPKLTYRTLEGWINTARAESDGSRVFQIGIANLEALLLLIVPEETVLLANYPNPFNPETWIPYHLSKHGKVTLTIYAIGGEVVQHLDLGHQVAGFYQSKSRAAHWDGRNNVGERVASGVYFYTLKTDEFAATRKMLIRK